MGNSAWIQQAGDVDSRDAIHWPLIFNSNYALVPSPFQWHITPSSHNIVKVPYDYFKVAEKSSSIGEFGLESGIKVKVLRGPFYLTLRDLIALQTTLIKLDPEYAIPTVLQTTKPFYQPSPGSDKFLWGSIEGQGNTFTVWLPNNQHAITDLTGSCSGVIRKVRKIDSNSKYQIYTSLKSSDNCAIKLKWS